MSNLAYGTFTITNLSTVTSVDVYYYNSTSSTSLSGGSWSTNTPTWTNGKYIWSKTVTTWEQGVTTESKPVCITGQKGSTGAAGQSVTKITQQYALGTNSTTAPTSGWSTAMPAFESGKFYWTRSEIVWTNPSSTTYTTAVLANGLTSANTNAETAKTDAASAVSTANTANQTANTANQTANTANQTAQNAVSIANGKNTIYYNSSKPTGGTYKAGDTWFNLTTDGYRLYEYDATAKDWVQKSMDGKSITAGTVTAAQIHAGAITTDKLATNAIKSVNYAAGTAPYSLTGTFLDLSNGNIFTPNFGVNNDSTDNIDNGAYIKGTIQAYDGKIGSDNNNYWYIGNYFDYNQGQSAMIRSHGTAAIQLGDSSTWRLSTNRIHTAWNDDSTSGEAFRLHYPTYGGKYWDSGLHVPASATDKLLYIRNAATTVSLENLQNDINDNSGGNYWNYQFYLTNDGSLYAKNIYIMDDNGGTVQIGGTDGVYLLKSGGTISGNLEITGTLKMQGNFLNKSGSAITLQTNLASTSAVTLTGNSTSPIKLGVTGTLPVANGGTGNTNYTSGGIVYVSNTSPKTLLSNAAGTSGQLLASGGSGVPTWVNASSLTVAAATKATQDGNGKVIATTYLPLTGGNVTGPVNFGDSVSIDDLTAGTLIVTGSSSFTNNAQFNTINGVTVGSNPKFTDTVTTVSTTGNGNAVTAITASNGAITVTKGTTFLTGITSSQVTTALGYTPYNSTNPNGYTTNTGTVTQVTAGTGLKIGTASSGGNITTIGTINHINSVTAQATQALYPIKIDAQGHISAYGSAVTSWALSAITGADDLKAIEALTGTSGFLKKTAANTWGLDTNTYLTGITSSQITTALGYTPYNSTNPNGYTSNTGTVTSVAASGSGGITISGSPITTSGTIAIGLNLSTAINGLGEGASPATRNDYIVAQYAGGGTTTTTYHRRKLSNIFAALIADDIPNLAWSKITSGNDDLKAIEALTGTSGLLKKTAANTWTLDTNTYLTGITSSQVTTALGYTPYNATNPNGYTTNTGTVTKVTAGSGLKINTNTSGGDITTTGTINHINSVTAQTTQGLYPIKIDAQGHISAYGSAVTTWALSNITGADDLKAIEALTGTSGFLKKTAANTWSLDTTSYVPTTRKVNGHALSSDVTVTKGDVGLGNVTNYQQITGIGQGANGSLRVWTGDPTSTSTDDYTDVTITITAYDQSTVKKAVALDLKAAVGSTSKPVYFKADGKPYEIGYTIEKSVPSNAVFTDTTYTFDGTYNASSNKAATVSTVTNAINALDGGTIGTGGKGKTITSLSQSNGNVSATFADISITKSQISDFPTSLAPTSHTHGNIQNGGTLQTNDITIANGDKLVVTDSSDSNKVARTSISFDGSTATKALTQKGTWETFNNYSLPLAASGTRGGIQIGYSSSGKNYAVQLSSQKAYVNVPWTDTTYSAGTGLSLSGTTFSNSGVTGIKGNAESTYKTGNVNLTADQVGAIPKNTNGNTQNLSRPLHLNGLNDNTLDSKINTLRANRLAFLPADQIIIEKTTDGGTTWVDAGFADSTKIGLFSETRTDVNIPLLNGVRSLKCGLRITITAMKYNVPSGTAETSKYNYWNSDYVISTERYNQLKEMYFWVSAVNDTISIKVERATGAKPNNWSVIFEDTSWGATGWSGNDYVRFGQNTFGGGTTQTSNYWNYRITFMTRGANGGTTLATSSTTASQSIMEIRGYGDTWWTAGNNYAANDCLYSHDYLKNATFPAQITATQFNGLATKATGDKNGADIATTYLKLAGGTMTGVLTAKGNIYEDSYSGALNMNNSNIYGINSIYTADVSDSSQEGIHFYRDTTHVDSIHAKSGVLYFTPNRPLGETGTSYSIYHTGNKPSKTDVGLGNVENKSSATIRGEITSSNVTTALGYTPTHNISLGGHSDHDRCVIALCETSATDTGINSWSNGVLMRQRDNGLIATKIAYVTFNGAYGPAYSAHYSLLCNYENTSIEARGITEGFRACTFTYNNKKYAGLEFYQVQASIFFYTQLGGTFIPFMVRYYNTNSATVINSEINNSLVYGSSTLFRQPFTAQQVNGHTIEADVPANAKFTDTWNALSTSQAGYVSKAPNNTSQFLRGDASWANVTKDNVGLGNVENKSSATIRGEITSSNVTTALGYTPVNKAGDTMAGTLNWNSTSLPQFSGSPTYLVGIQGFTNGGTMKWQFASSITVGAATKATQDKNGNDITTKYVTIDTTQTITGRKTFSDLAAVTFKPSSGTDKCNINYDASLGALVFSF